jgi:uncharacterized protein
VNDTVVREPESAGPPQTQTALLVPPPPGMPPAPPGTATPPPPRGPLTGLALGPWGAIAYAGFVIVFNVCLALVARSSVVAQALRVLVESVAGAQPAARELFAAGLTGFIALLGYAVILLPAVALARRRGLSFAEAVGLRRFRVGPAIGYALAVVVGGVLVTVAYSLTLRSFGVSTPNNTVQLVQGFGGGPLAMAIGFVLVGVIAPFVEEVAFRGVVFAGLRAGWGTVWAVLISGALFGIVHLEPLETVPLALIGMGLAVVFARSRSLWPAIIAHGAYNVVVLSVAFASFSLVR